MIRALVILLALAPAALAAVGNPEDRLRDAGQEARAQAIGRELRCLVCQNQSIEDSDAAVAADLRRIVRERVVAGDPDTRIIAFVHDRYGDFVLLRPPVNAATALLWATPALALLGGIFAIRSMRRRVAATPEPAPLTEAERLRLARWDETPRA